jgi:hypothetical protein
MSKNMNAEHFAARLCRALARDPEALEALIVLITAEIEKQNSRVERDRGSAPPALPANRRKESNSRE